MRKKKNKKDRDDDIQVLTVQEGARMAGCCEESVRRAVRSGALKSARIESVNRIFLSDKGVKEWMEYRKQKIKPEVMKQIRQKFKEME